MKSAQLLLLSSAAFLAACNACSQKKPETPDTPASPPPATNNDVIPSKPTVTTVFFSTEEKTLFWMETTNGTHAAPPDTSFWTGSSVIVPENDGWHVYETDGNNYGIAAAPTEGITAVAEVLKKETTAPDGYAWEPETSANGFQKVFINPAMGKRQRIGVFPKPPTDPVWMEGERPTARGAETPMLSKASGFQTREDGKAYKNEAPLGSTAVAAAAASDADKATWIADLGKLRAAEITLDLSQMIDLDADGTAEGFACITGGRGNPCYVIDTVGEQVRYYTTTIQWQPGQAETPQYFSTGKGSYIMHSPEGAVTGRGSGIIRLVRFDGGGYATETIQ